MSVSYPIRHHWGALIHHHAVLVITAPGPHSVLHTQPLGFWFIISNLQDMTLHVESINIYESYSTFLYLAFHTTTIIIIGICNTCYNVYNNTIPIPAVQHTHTINPNLQTQ